MTAPAGTVPPSRADVARALDGTEVRVQRLVSAAIVASQLVLLGVVLAVSASRAASAPAERDAPPRHLSLLAAATVPIALASIAAAAVVPRLATRAQVRRAASAAAVVRALRAEGVVRLALLEAGSTFGLVVCLLAALDGRLAHEPGWWLNAAPLAVLLAAAARSWPARDALLHAYDRARLPGGGHS